MAAGDLVMYSKHKRNMMNGTSPVDYDDGNVKMMLLTSAYVPNALVNEFISEISANQVVTGTSYVAGGPALTTPSVALVGANTVFDADDVTLAVDAVAGFTDAKWFVFYYDTGVAGTSELLAYGDYGTNKSIIDSSLVTQWDATGIIEW